MRLLALSLTASAIVVALLGACRPAVSSPELVEPLRVVERGWNSLDAVLMATAWHSDAALVNSVGGTLEGGDRIEQHFRGVFSSPIPGTRHHFHVERVRVVAPRVAVLDGRLDKSRGVELLRTTLFTAVVVRRHGSWKLSDVRVYVPQSPEEVER